MAIVDGFGLERIRLADLPVPSPGPGELLIRLKAASLNYRDLLVASGQYNSRYPLPLILGSDAVGEVVELGPDLAENSFGLGERVCPIFAQGWLDGPPKRETNRLTLGGPLPGVFAEYVVVRCDSVVRVPAYLDDLEAACLPCAGVTAWSSLCTLNSLRDGDTVLTLGGGGVSVFALQIARLHGARVLATARSPEKRDRLLTLGADGVIDASSEGWGRRARALAEPEGFDHVIEVAGGAALTESLHAVRPAGTISLIGVAAGRHTSLDLTQVVMRNVRLQGVLVGHRRSFHALLEAFERTATRPIIDSAYPLDQAFEAFARLQSGAHFGKVCLRIP